MNIGGEWSGTPAEEAAIKDDNVISNLPATPATPACAACKFQRRKCSAECPLAPYFPADRLQDFQNVRKLFGVKNVLKALADLDPSERFTAVECMIYEANCRALDLTGGCYRIIAELQREIMTLEAERQFVFSQIRSHRQTAAMDPAVIRGGGSGRVHSEFYGVGSDRKLGLSSLLLDCTINDLGNFEDRIQELCSLNGVERLIKKENGIDFNLQENH